MRRLLILVLLGGASLGAQSIKVAPSTLVTTASAEHPIVEPHLAVDPVHPDRLLAAAFARANPPLAVPRGPGQSDLRGVSFARFRRELDAP